MKTKQKNVGNDQPEDSKNGMGKIDTKPKNAGNMHTFTSMKTSTVSKSLLECDGSTSRLCIKEVIL